MNPRRPGGQTHRDYRKDIGLTARSARVLEGRAVVRSGKRRPRSLPVLTALAALLLCFPIAAQARVGGLDASFGLGGKVATQLGVEVGASQAIRSDGAILIGDGRTLSLFDPSGTLDGTFGVNGQVELPSELEGLPLGLLSYSFDRQGRILMFGGVVDPNRKYVDQVALRSFNASWGVVMRLLPSGDLDTSFGAGKGYFRSDFGLRTTVYAREVGAPTDPDIPTTRIGTGLADSQGRPVFVIEALAPSGPCFYGKGFLSAYPRAVVRLTSDGRLDLAFGGGDGISEISGGEWGSQLQRDSADGLIIATNTDRCDGNKVFRFGADGLPIATFGRSGMGRYPGLTFFSAGPGSKLTFGGSVAVGRRIRPAVFRANSFGKPDARFGKAGKAAVNLPAGVERQWMIAGVDALGRTVLVGTFDLPKPRKKTGRKPSNNGGKNRTQRSYLFVKRLLPDGKLDRALGRQGNIITQFERPRHLRINGAELDEQGRLVVLVGSIDVRQLPDTHLTIVRYTL